MQFAYHRYRSLFRQHNLSATDIVCLITVTSFKKLGHFMDTFLCKYVWSWTLLIFSEPSEYKATQNGSFSTQKQSIHE